MEIELLRISSSNSSPGAKIMFKGPTQVHFFSEKEENWRGEFQPEISSLSRGLKKLRSARSRVLKLGK